MHDAGVDAAMDQDPIHRLLTMSGARWRTTQPEPAPVAPTIFVRDARRIGAGFGGRAWPFLAGVAFTVAVVAFAAAIAPGWLPQRPDVAGPVSSAIVHHKGGDLAHCPITKPTGHFQPPQDGEIPANKAWYGNPILWTWLDRDGEVWDGLQRSETGLGQKTFWWSSFFDVRREPQPDIFVIGDRIGPPGQFGFGPGTNAGGEFGSAMLVGVDVPEEGCWNVTAHYRGASLNYVVWVGPRS
jgi:hypothetical protein